MCGIFGIIGSTNAFVDIYKGLKVIQHRGQDTCGIITFSNKFNIKLSEGLVINSFNEQDLSKLQGSVGIGHVRYPTIGKAGIENAQPVFTNTPFGIAMAHNGNVVNYFALKNKLIKDYHRYINSDGDIQIILNIFAYHLSKNNDFNFQILSDSVKNVFKEVKGSYSVISYIAGKGFLAFRDPVGYRPLVFGTDGKRYAFASESVSLESIGINKFEDVKPGEVIFISDRGKIYRKVVSSSQHKACIFEWVYFARPDSIIDGIDVYNARYRLGERLADVLMERKDDFDVVVPIPDTSRTAALALATKLNLPYREGLIKNRYIGRTFIMPGQKKRIDAIREKLNPIKIELKNKRVLLVDDSIVRGNTSKSIIKLVRESGAKEVHFAVYSPPLKYPCFFGIDIQKTDEFIVNKTSFEKIASEIGADSLTYLPLEKLIDGVGMGRKDFCHSCFSGKYDIKLNRKDLEAIKKDRLNSC